MLGGVAEVPKREVVPPPCCRGRRQHVAGEHSSSLSHASLPFLQFSPTEILRAQAAQQDNPRVSRGFGQDQIKIDRYVRSKSRSNMGEARLRHGGPPLSPASPFCNLYLATNR